MPEMNFEEQARDMVNGFEMKPKPAIWENVRNVIQEPRRKKRFVLWWWLLPIGLLGGGIVFYLLPPVSKEVQVRKVISTPQKSLNTLMPPKPATPPHINAEQKIKKEDKSIVVKTQKTNRAKYPQLIERDPVIIKGNGDIKGDEVIIKGIVKDSIIAESAVDNHKRLSTLNGSALLLNNNNAANNSNSILENQQAPLAKESVNTTSLPKDSALAKTAAHADSSANIISKKQKKKTGLHWGLLAEGGFATRSSSILSIADFEKSNTSQSFVPAADGIDLGIIGLSNGNSFYYSNDIKKGAAYGFGISMEKPLNRTIDFFADVAYHYQSFGITNAVYKDSLVLNNSSNSFAGSYGAKQTFHFSSLFAGINWHFINTKQLQFGLSAGVDNLLLLSAKQKLNGITSNNFSLQDAQQISDSIFSKSNFYRYQPSLFAGVLVNIKMGSSQLQLVPFTRSGFRLFDKHISGSNNHLFSAGLRAVYFFK